MIMSACELYTFDKYGESRRVHSMAIIDPVSARLEKKSIYFSFDFDFF